MAARLQSGGLPTYVVIGVVAMLTDFSTLVFLLPATHEIARAAVPWQVKQVALLVLVVLLMIPLLLPVLGLTLLGKRADSILAKTNAIVTRYPRQINASVCLFIAALVAHNAIKG